MVLRICEIMVTLDFIFRLMLYSHEDVSFNTIFLNALEGIKSFTCNVVQENPTRNVKGVNVKAKIKNVKL